MDGNLRDDTIDFERLLTWLETISLRTTLRSPVDSSDFVTTPETSQMAI